MKKRYLCPVCERELTGGYCSECHRFRRDPLVYTGGCLPNERDPDAYTQIKLEAFEERCRGAHTAVPSGSSKAASSGKGRTGTAQPYPKPAVKTASAGKAASGKSYSRYYDTCGTDYKHTYGIPNTDPHKKAASDKERAAKGRKAVFGLIVLIWLAVMFAGPITSLVRSLVGNSGSPAPEETSVEAECRTYTEEEILEAGEPCNGYVHYEMDGESYIALLEGNVSEMWPDASLEREEKGASYWGYVFGTGDEPTYYTRSTVLPAQIDGWETEVWIVSDAVTGEVMEVEISSGDSAVFRKMALCAICGLEPSTDRNELWDRVRELYGEVEKESWCMDTIGQSEVIFAIEEGTYSGRLDCREGYGKY